jgi:hypothetical protein
MAIGGYCGYYISGYIINGYSISGYWWLFY